MSRAESAGWDLDSILQLLIDRSAHGVFIIESGRIIYANRAMRSILGAESLEEIRGALFKSFIDPADSERVTMELANLLAKKVGADALRFRMVNRAHSRRIEVEASVGALSKEDIGSNLIFGSISDVTERVEMIRKLRRSEEELKSIITYLPAPFVRISVHGLIKMISPSIEAMTDFSPEELINESDLRLFENEGARDKVFEAALAGDGAPVEVETRFKTKARELVWVSGKIVLRKDTNDDPLYIEGVFQDITDRKKMEIELRNLTRTDPLTNTRNRRYFFEKGIEELERAKRYRRDCSLLMIDIDHFKSINDKFGHAGGDAVLKEFAATLLAAARSSDLVARLGGEEFAVMLLETNLDEAIIFSERLRKLVGAMRVAISDSEPIAITISIGVSAYRSILDDRLESLLKRADSALYEAKETGRDRVVAREE